MKLKVQQSGFSLVELMISMVLGLMLLAGLIAVLQSNRVSALFTKEQSMIQEDGRFVLNYIRQFIKITGHDEWFKPLNPNTRFGAEVAWVGTDAQAGKDDTDGDKLTLIYETPSNIVGFRTCNGTEVVTQVPAAGGNPATVNVSVDKVREEFTVNATNKTLVCESFNVATGASLGSSEIIGGVLDFQVVYGVNLSADIQAEPDQFTYLNATRLLAKNWSRKETAQRLMSLKYALLIESDSDNGAVSRTQDNTFYVLDHAVRHTGKTPNLYTSTYKFRNGG